MNSHFQGSNVTPRNIPKVDDTGTIKNSGLPSNGRIQPCSAHAFELLAGEELLVIDPCGQQVSDLVAFSKHAMLRSLFRRAGRSTMLQKFG